jgi:hypothetical protein
MSEVTRRDAIKVAAGVVGAAVAAGAVRAEGAPEAKTPAEAEPTAEAEAGGLLFQTYTIRDIPAAGKSFIAHFKGHKLNKAFVVPSVTGFQVGDAIGGRAGRVAGVAARVEVTEVDEQGGKVTLTCHCGLHVSDDRPTDGPTDRARRPEDERPPVAC